MFTWAEVLKGIEVYIKEITNDMFGYVQNITRVNVIKNLYTNTVKEKSHLNSFIYWKYWFCMNQNLYLYKYKIYTNLYL